ncbi:MAG: sigma-70 family RNA polymerase sigma factor [Actinomycetota bacterium]
MFRSHAAYRHELLDAPAEQELGRRIEAGLAAADRLASGQARPGDEELVADADAARRAFIEANLRLVLSIAGNYQVPAHLDRDDLVQDGMLGLDKAATRFDWRRGLRFSTYATWWIRQSIQRGLENSSGAVRIPAHRRSELRVALRHVDGEIGQLRDDLRHVHSMTTLDSIDRMASPTDGGAAVEPICGEDGPEDAVIDDLVADRTRELLEHLSAECRRAIVLRFGFEGGEPASYREIAEDLGVTPEAARRRTLRALDRLQELGEPILAA